MSVNTGSQVEWTSRACPTCGSQDTSRVFAEASYDASKLDAFSFSSRKTPDRMHFRLVDCPTCRSLYSSPVANKHGLSDAYRDAAFDAGEESTFASHTYARLLPEIARALPNKNGAIDIGAGDGTFVSRLLEHGFSDVVGIEPSRAPITQASPAVRPLLRNTIFDGNDFAPSSVSLVTCFQTIEHVDDPAALCKSALRILRPGGVLYIVCHNRRSLSARILGLRSPIFDIEHLQLFSPESITELLRRSGFDSVRAKPIYNVYPLHYWLRLLPLPGFLKKSLAAILSLTRMGRLPIPLPAGNLAVTARKP